MELKYEKYKTISEKTMCDPEKRKKWAGPFKSARNRNKDLAERHGLQFIDKKSVISLVEDQELIKFLAPEMGLDWKGGYKN